MKSHLSVNLGGNPHRLRQRHWPARDRPRVSIASVAQTTSNANTLTVTAYSNAADRAHGGADKLKSLGIHPQVRPGG